jgi:hypothetical protein
MTLALAPANLRLNIRRFWPASEWENAAAIAQLESNWEQFAVNQTTDADHPCGALLREEDGVSVYAEYSLGYFQINSCNFPDWDPRSLLSAYQNCGTAHMLWTEAEGWSPWYFSCHQLGLC